MAKPSHATARSDLQTLYNSAVTLRDNTKPGGSTEDTDVHQIARDIAQTIDVRFKSQFLRISGRDL
jgi:hypothetical protein